MRNEEDRDRREKIRFEENENNGNNENHHENPPNPHSPHSPHSPHNHKNNQRKRVECKSCSNSSEMSAYCRSCNIGICTRCMKREHNGHVELDPHGLRGVELESIENDLSIIQSTQKHVSAVMRNLDSLKAHIHNSGRMILESCTETIRALDSMKKRGFVGEMEDNVDVAQNKYKLGCLVDEFRAKARMLFNSITPIRSIKEMRENQEGISLATQLKLEPIGGFKVEGGPKEESSLPAKRETMEINDDEVYSIYII